MSVEQGVECVKEFLLRALLSSQKLNVIDQKKICLAIAFSELNQVTVLDRVDELVDEEFARDVDHFHVFLLRPGALTDGLHQMGLAETDAAINEQRVVCARRRLRNSETRCMCNFVVRTDDERLECVPWVESRHGCACFRIAC